MNRAVKNNPKKFPKGYIFELGEKEFDELVKNFHQFEKQKHSSVFPKAFTEKGLYMLATILKSSNAVQTTLAIVETYAKLKELSQVIVELPKEENDKETENVLLKRSGQLINEILDDTLPKHSSETSIELNLAMFKVKHSVKKECDDEIRTLKERIEQLETKLHDL